MQGKRTDGSYLIKIDVQGAELDVLAGATNIIPDTELVILEVSLFEFFVGGPQFYEVVNYMKKEGFVVYDLFGYHCRPIDLALAQIDVAFVKEHGSFRKHHFYATPQQREELDKSSHFTVS